MSSSPPQVDTSKPMWDAQAPTPGQAPMQSPYQPIQNYQGAFGFQGPTQAQYQNSFPQQQQQQQQQPSPMGKGAQQGGMQQGMEGMMRAQDQYRRGFLDENPMNNIGQFIPRHDPYGDTRMFHQ